jgi:D-arabinose 1-dehydrogenase-like Zn-dependent alcohol dehydrogenase
MRMWVTSRSEDKRAHASDLGVDAVFPSGARLPERVDIVLETVGAATWEHSIRSVRSGGTIVVSGATTGDAAPAQLSHIFFRQLNVVGSTMGTRSELASLLTMLGTTGVRPVVDTVIPVEEADEAFERLNAGGATGKIVLTWDAGA